MATSVGDVSQTAGRPAQRADPRAVRHGPMLIGPDGAASSEEVLRETAILLARRHRSALVAIVIKPGLALELIELPTATLGLPPATIDGRTALEIEQELYERANEAGRRAAMLLEQLGLSAEALVVAEESDVTVAATIVRLARERDARVVVVGAHEHAGLLGGTTRRVIREAPCPTLVVGERPAR
jgi:nucleotide-binding universal stress UspA family protein